MGVKQDRGLEILETSARLFHPVFNLLLDDPAGGQTRQWPPRRRKQQAPFSPSLLLPRQFQRLPKCVLLVAFSLRRSGALGQYQRFDQNEYNRILYNPSHQLVANE
jgi:hypothetical protein